MRSAASVSRYAKSGHVAKVLSELPRPMRVYTEWGRKNLKAVMMGTVRPQPHVHVVRGTPKAAEVIAGFAGS